MLVALEKKKNALTQTVNLGFMWCIDFICWDPLLVFIKIKDKNKCLHWLNFSVSIFSWLLFSLIWGYKKKSSVHTDKTAHVNNVMLQFQAHSSLSAHLLLLIHLILFCRGVSWVLIRKEEKRSMCYCNLDGSWIMDQSSKNSSEGC